MQTKDQKKIIAPERVAEIRPKLPKTYGEIIAEMLNDQYQPETIRHMVRGYRKMKPVVFEAANKLIEAIENLKSN
jgi:hypothetical protein